MYDHTISETDIAIVGMSSRFPGSKNTNELWRNLRDGVECITAISDDQLQRALLKSLGSIPQSALARWLNSPHYIRAGAVLEDIDLFDASFFDYNPTEAALMDPQQRIFLECAWEALEDAAYSTQTYQGLIGIYAGSEMSTYHHNLHTGILPSEHDLLEVIGNTSDYLATRVSYKLNLKGPSIAVQCACSTSLVAIHMACQSLKSGECDMALAGGVMAFPLQHAGYLYQQGGIVSPDGHCRPFDAQAQGTVFAHGGVGIVVLKRLADACADGDHIYAVVKGSAINNDGSCKTGYTAPSIDGQSKVILEAMAVADVDPGSISYIEAHGTATPLGDPIEIAALTQAFRTKTQRRTFCAIGSIKSNMGHLGVAAGVAGLIKTTLALKYKMIPPSLHYEQPNPQIDFATSPFYVNTQLTAWNTNALPRRAGVSSFGMGGTNAHVILEEAPMCDPSSTSRSRQLILLSAKTSSALDKMRVNLLNHLKSHPDLDLADLAFTLQLGRKAFPHRLMFVCQTVAEAVSQLEANHCFLSKVEPGEHPVAFMFPGQGSQYVNMGRELYNEESTFRAQVDTCAKFLEPYLHCDLRAVLYPAAGQEEMAQKQLDQTSLTQPALFVIAYAMAQLWIKRGVRPHAMIGHSIGEYVAACLAGVFSLEDALTLVALRGRLMQQLPGGSMLAVSLPEKDILAFLTPRLCLAVHNSTTDWVISGPTDAIEQLERHLTAKNIACRCLHTSHAFHSQMMDAILAQFSSEMKKVSLHPPTTPYLSNLTGTWITAQEATDPDYWVKHLRQTVRFAEGVQLLLNDPTVVLLEVGPGRSLTTLAQRMVTADQLIVSSLRHPHAPVSDYAFLLHTCGQLWCAGVAVNWSELSSGEQRRRISLPTYPFERERYWVFPSQAMSPQVIISEIAIQASPADAQTVPLHSELTSAEQVMASMPQRRPHVPTAYIPARNEVEQHIATIWQEMLGIENIGIQDNFFEVGGDSLMGIRIINQLRNVFEVGVSIPLHLFFTTPTIEGMAEVITQKLLDNAQLAEMLKNGSSLSE